MHSRIRMLLTPKTPSMIYTKLEAYITSLHFEGIPQERKETLQPLIDYIQSHHSAQTPIRLNFICTHNSRRSHLSQVWAQTAAAFYDIREVFCYSGGTEATALFPSAAEALEIVGFHLQKLSEQNNPVYSIHYSDIEHPIIGFSKTYDNMFNPASEFAAIMTCSQADKGCPLIVGAQARIPITYEDPKAFDQTPQQQEKYAERSQQIATEMSYVFSNIISK